MNLFYRQLFFLTMILLPVFGGAAYLTYYEAGNAVRELVDDNARLLAVSVKNSVARHLPSDINTEDGLSDSLRNVISSSITADIGDSSGVQKLVLVVPPQGQTLLPIIGNDFDIPDSIRIASVQGLTKDDNLRQLLTEDDIRIVSFQPSESTNLVALLEIAPDKNIAGNLHSLTVKYYLLGFAGILLALVLAMLSTRFVKLPLKHLEKVISNIEKKKFSYRIRLNKNHEFYELYERINKVMAQLHQMDSNQRATANARNVALKDMRTFSRYLDIMAHEIKNPLHAMGINLDVLKTKIQQQKPKADTLKHTRILEREVEHLQQVIQGFFDLCTAWCATQGP